MNFEATIRFKGTFYTFIFTEIKSINSLKYFVRTKIKNGDNVFFEIVKVSGGSWKVVQPVPEWISTQEQDLIAVVQRHQT